MYKVDPTAAAIPSLWVGGATGLHVFDLTSHHSQLFILWLDVGPRKIGSQDCNRVITEFTLYWSALYWICSVSMCFALCLTNWHLFCMKMKPSFQWQSHLGTVIFSSVNTEIYFDIILNRILVSQIYLHALCDVAFFWIICHINFLPS